MAVSNIVKGALISYLSIFLNIAISFFYTPWMIKQIGVSDYGLYSLTISFISYFIMDFGLSKSISRFIAKYRAEDNVPMVSNMLGLTTKAYLIIDTVIFLVLLVLFFFLSEIFGGLTAAEISKLKILYSIAACFSVLSFMFRPLDGAMVAFEFFVENKSIDMIQKVGTVLLICLALLLDGGVYLLVLINGATSLLTSIVKFLVFKKKSTVNIYWGYRDKKQLGDIFSFSFWAFGRGLAQRMRLSLIPSVLGMFCNTTEVSLFALGMTVQGMVYTLSSAINDLFLPKISRMSHANDKSAIMDLMIRVGRIELYIITFIFSAFLIFGRDFITLWVGEEFYKVYYIVIFLIFPNIVTFTQNTAENLVFVENKIRYTTSIILGCSILGLVASCLFARQYGAVGCALCSGIALFADVVIVNFFYHRNMSLDIPTFFKRCHLQILPLCLVPIGIVFFLLRSIDIVGWIDFILLGAGYTMFFALYLYWIVLNDYEKALIKSLIRK